MSYVQILPCLVCRLHEPPPLLRIHPYGSEITAKLSLDWKTQYACAHCRVGWDQPFHVCSFTRSGLDVLVATMLRQQPQERPHVHQVWCETTNIVSLQFISYCYLPSIHRATSLKVLTQLEDLRNSELLSGNDNGGVTHPHTQSVLQQLKRNKRN